MATEEDQGPKPIPEPCPSEPEPAPVLPSLGRCDQGQNVRGRTGWVPPPPGPSREGGGRGRVPANCFRCLRGSG